MALMLIDTRDPLPPDPGKLRPDYGLALSLLVLLAVALAANAASGAIAVGLCLLGLTATLLIGRYALRRTRP